MTQAIYANIANSAVETLSAAGKDLSCLFFRHDRQRNLAYTCQPDFAKLDQP